MSMNISIEKAISEMGVELKLEDCERFSEVVAICKHSGGNLVNWNSNSTGGNYCDMESRRKCHRCRTTP